MIPRAIALLSLLTTGPAFAESHDPFFATGDADAGASAFGRQCVACHVVVNEDGEKLAGRNGRSGPNLFAMAGAAAGTVDGYKYGKSLLKAGSDEFGLVWDEENFADYVMDPTGFLRAVLDDKKARAKMTFKVKAREDALNLYAFLHSLAPPAAPEAEAEATN